MIAPHTAFSPVQLRRLALDELKGGSAVVALRGDGLAAGNVTTCAAGVRADISPATRSRV